MLPPTPGSVIYYSFCLFMIFFCLFVTLTSQVSDKPHCLTDVVYRSNIYPNYEPLRSNVLLLHCLFPCLFALFVRLLDNNGRLNVSWRQGPHLLSLLTPVPNTSPTYKNICEKSKWMRGSGLIFTVFPNPKSLSHYELTRWWLLIQLNCVLCHWIWCFSRAQRPLFLHPYLLSVATVSLAQMEFGY